MSSQITTVRSIMRALAAAIRDGGAGSSRWPDGMKAPLVYLDGISDEWEPPAGQEDAPVVVVAAESDNGLGWGGDYGWTLSVLVARDCSSADANRVPSRDPGDGIRAAGDGEALEAAVDAVTDIVRAARPGAILRGLSRQWSFHSLPVQFAVLSLDYMSPGTYAETDDDHSTTF